MDHPWAILLSTCVALTLVLAGCSPPEQCTYGGAAQAWIDANGNVRWDDGEEPLPGVEVEITADEDVDSAEGHITDGNGEAEVGVMTVS